MALPMPDSNNTIGALLIGGLFAMVLWGTICSQTYTYFTYSFNDPWYIKLMVVFLWCLDTFDSALNVHILYFYMVTNYSNPLALYEPTWSFKIHVAVTSLSNFLIHTAFVEKIFFLSGRNIWLTAWLMASSSADLVVGCVITVKLFSINSFLEMDGMSSFADIKFPLGTGSNISLAVTLCFLLRRSRTGSQATDSMISTLMAYSLNTCVIVAIDATLAMITYSLMPNNMIFLGFYLLLSKLYLNSYLASLNAREKLRFNKENIPTIPHSQMSECQWAVERSSSPGLEKGNHGILQADTSRTSVPMATKRDLHDKTGDRLAPSSTTVYMDEPSCAA